MTKKVNITVMKKDYDKEKPNILGGDKAYLSWKKADFLAHNAEVPESLLNDNIHTEGELMSEEDIIKWIIDTQKTFKVIKEQDEEVFNKLYQGFILDLEYLTKIDKIDEDSVDEILRQEHF